MNMYTNIQIHPLASSTQDRFWDEEDSGLSDEEQKRKG